MATVAAWSLEMVTPGWFVSSRLRCTERVISGGSSSIPSQECIPQPAEGAYMPLNTNCDFMQRMRRSDMRSQRLVQEEMTSGGWWL